MCVCTSGRTCERRYVRWNVHSSRACARTKIRSTGVYLISVRLGFSLPIYFWVNVSTHVRTLTRPSTRTHTSVHSYFTRPLVRLHVRWVVHLLRDFKTIDNNFLYRIRNVKSWKMVRFNPLLCLGVPTQCQRFQFYRGPWGLWFYRDFILNTALTT